MAYTIATTLERFGAPFGSQVSLTGGITLFHINYLDLKQFSDEGITPSVVVEFQRKPILYVVESQNLSTDPETKKKELLNIKRNLACRGDADYMAVLKPGQLEIFSIGLKNQLDTLVTKSENDKDASSVIPSIALGKLYPKRDIKEEKIHDLLFRLMNQAKNKLIGDKVKRGLEPDDALSLTGRALFLRFLMDRKVITNDNLNMVCPEANDLVDCLSDSKKANYSNAWLDTIFNGDLLPLSQKNISQLLENLNEEKKKEIFLTLKHILKKSILDDEGIQERLNWQDIDFAHVPVGLLSQVYERHCHIYDKDIAKQTSIHYTPRNIAEYMVEEVFSGLKDNHKAKILDPAAGAGVFLVLCFRKLVENWWKEKSERPDRERIRDILYDQIRGFEINKPALNLAAFSLYLTAIELDPDPADLNNIKFDKIMGKVLFDVRSPEDEGETGPILGSLDLQNTQGHEGIYDIVIGNPPWTPFLGEKYGGIRKKFHKNVRGIANKRGLKDVATDYHNPDGVPDLPFVWCATQWCTKGGRIAFALHSRILFKNSDVGVKARNALFSALKITGILNGSYLRQTGVWPEVDAPFCLLFAENTVPDSESLFTYISPELENGINDKGYFRIDSESAQPIQISCLKDNPALLKSLFRGTALDVQVIDKINKNKLITIDKYWGTQWETPQNGIGYLEGKQDKPPGFLKKYRNLDIENFKKYLRTGRSSPFFIDPDKLDMFNPNKKVEKRRDESIYKGPMVLFKKFPSVDRNKGRVMLSLKDLVFSQSFYGYSSKGHENSKELSEYLFLLLNSDLFLYYTLMTSGSFGIERDQIIKKDVDDFPIMPIENLSKEDLQTIDNLVGKLINENQKTWSDIDKFIYKIYDIDEFDQEVIKDSLDVSLPFAESKKHAQEPPKQEEIEQFAKRLEQALKPFYEIVGKHISIKPVILKNYPWAFLELNDDKTRDVTDDIYKKIILQVMEIADKTGASRIIIRDKKPLLIGILKQYKYWTPTRARLTAIHLLRNKDISHQLIS